MTWISPIIGVLLLFFGRNLFWLFLGGLGFWFGWQLSGELLQLESQQVRWLVSLAAGVLGALTALAIQNLAVGLAGFLAGSMLASKLLAFVSLGDTQPIFWVIVLLGGIAGAIFTLSLFEWALIVLSAFFGALLLLAPFDLTGLVEIAVMSLLAFVGMSAQVKRGPEPKRKPS